MIKGSIVAIVTPMHEDGSLDLAAFRALIDFHIGQGTDGIVVVGTTGESPTVNVEEHELLIAEAVKHAAKRIPVIAGTGANSTREAIELAAFAKNAGADASLTVVPYYNKPTQEGMYQHFKTVAAATNKPIILYNVPGRTGSNLLPATVIRLAADCKNIVGIKEASGNIVQNMELLQNKPDNFTVLSGDDNLVLAQMAIGMEGIISVAANCFTKDITDIINLVIVGKFDKARKVHYKLLPGLDLLFADGNPPGVKYVLSRQGLCLNTFRLPVVPVSDATAKKLDAFLKTI